MLSLLRSRTTRPLFHFTFLLSFSVVYLFFLFCLAESSVRKVETEGRKRRISAGGAVSKKAFKTDRLRHHQPRSASNTTRAPVYRQAKVIFPLPRLSISPPRNTTAPLPFSFFHFFLIFCVCVCLCLNAIALLWRRESNSLFLASCGSDCGRSVRAPSSALVAGTLIHLTAFP